MEVLKLKCMEIHLNPKGLKEVVIGRLLEYYKHPNPLHQNQEQENAEGSGGKKRRLNGADNVADDQFTPKPSWHEWTNCPTMSNYWRK